MKLRFYISFRSPFAAISLYRLRRLDCFKAVEIELMPVWPEVIFGGHIDNPSDNLFKMSYIFGDAARQAALAGLNRGPFDRLAERFHLPEGVDYSQQKIGVPLGEEHWERTHKAFLYALNEGEGWAFADAICIRRFNFDGEGVADVMNVEVIRALAESVGLDGDATLAAIDDPLIDAQMKRIIQCSEQDGVFGVPFFVLESEQGPDKFWGNDRLEHLLMQIEGKAHLSQLPVVRLDDVVR